MVRLPNLCEPQFSHLYNNNSGNNKNIFTYKFAVKMQTAILVSSLSDVKYLASVSFIFVGLGEETDLPYLAVTVFCPSVTLCKIYGLEHDQTRKELGEMVKKNKEQGISFVLR